MKQHNSFKKDIDMLAEAYGFMQSEDSSVLNESADAPNPVEDNGEAAYKGGIIDHDWASHITAPPFGESIKKILHHNLTEQGIVEEYYVEHNGKLVGVLAEDVTVVFEEGHGKKKRPASDEEGGGKKAYDEALATYNYDMREYMGSGSFNPLGPVYDEEQIGPNGERIASKGMPIKPNPADYGLSENEEDEESTAHGARPKLIGVPIYR